MFGEIHEGLLGKHLEGHMFSKRTLTIKEDSAIRLEVPQFLKAHRHLPRSFSREEHLVFPMAFHMVDNEHFMPLTISIQESQIFNFGVNYFTKWVES